MKLSENNNTLPLNESVQIQAPLDLTKACKQLLSEIGENPNRPGLQKTPQRFIDAIREITSGYSDDITTIVNGALFEDQGSEMVVVRDIEFYSLCEHHMLPFFGKAHIAYIPDGKIIGLSKIPRIVEMFARRLQVQERLTTQITKQLESILQPKGVVCLIEGSHLCMMMRGVKSTSGSMRTQSTAGVFKSDAQLLQQFLLHSGADSKQF